MFKNANPRQPVVVHSHKGMFRTPAGINRPAPAPPKPEKPRPKREYPLIPLPAGSRIMITYRQGHTLLPADLLDSQAFNDAMTYQLSYACDVPTLAVVVDLGVFLNAVLAAIREAGTSDYLWKYITTIEKCISDYGPASGSILVDVCYWLTEEEEEED